MRVLVACEFSGIVRDAFIAQGHTAISCDLLPTERTGPHYQGDVRDIIDEMEFDLLVAFPPCTYLSYAGLKYWDSPGRAEARNNALEFVRFLMATPIHRIAIENPRGCINTEIRPSDQIISPYMFGHKEEKRTHLWLKNLPPLMATSIAINREQFVPYVGRKGEKRKKDRSRTFQGIANAMASQWSF